MSQVRRFSVFMWHRPSPFSLEENQQSLGAYWMSGLTYVLASILPRTLGGKKHHRCAVRSPGCPMTHPGPSLCSRG